MEDISQTNKRSLKAIFGEAKYKKWLIAYPILIDKDVISWLQAKIEQFEEKQKDPAKFSLTSYVNALQQYCKKYEASIQDLLNEELDKRNGRLRDYLKFLLNAKEGSEEEKEIKALGYKKIPSRASVINLVQSRIKSFFSSRARHITWGMKTETSGANKGEIILNKGLIQKIREKLESPEYRLICRCQSQLGLRISDILNTLTSGDYRIEEFEEHYFIRNFRTMKLDVVINYLFITEELGKALEGFHTSKDLTTLDLTTLFKTKKGNTINKTDYLTRIKTVAKEMNIIGNVKTHSFRKYFSGQLRKCIKIDIEFREHLMGHTNHQLGNSYANNLKDVNWYYKQWLDAEMLICVDCVDRTDATIKKTNAEVLKLIKDNRKFNETIENLENENLKLKGLIVNLDTKYKEIESNITKKAENIATALVNEILNGKHLDSYPNGYIGKDNKGNRTRMIACPSCLDSLTFRGDR